MIPPIKKTLTVPASPEFAFRRFTDEIGTWWPLANFSIGKGEVETCFMEGRDGGRVYERLKDGTINLWGTVTAWDPPRRVVFTWHILREASSDQEVEVTFTPVSGGTRVGLTHTGWEVLGDRAVQERENYNGGWDFVLGQYERTVEFSGG